MKIRVTGHAVARYLQRSRLDVQAHQVERLLKGVVTLLSPRGPAWRVRAGHLIVVGKTRPTEMIVLSCWYVTGPARVFRRCSARVSRPRRNARPQVSASVVFL